MLPIGGALIRLNQAVPFRALIARNPQPEIDATLLIAHLRAPVEMILITKIILCGSVPILGASKCVSGPPLPHQRDGVHQKRPEKHAGEARGQAPRSRLTLSS
jgi:hypothetical protein